MGPATLSRLINAGLLIRVGHGVYQLAGAPPTMHLEIKVAWLRLDPATPAWRRHPQDEHSGIISLSSACQLHEVGDLPHTDVEILVPRRRATRTPGVHLRREPVDLRDITVIDGLPVTTAERTIIDLLHAHTDGGHAGSVIADADRRAMIDLGALADRVAPFTEAYGLQASASGLDLLVRLAAEAGEELAIGRADKDAAHAARKACDCSQQPDPANTA